MNDTPIERTPTVFISYSWDSPEHKRWVHHLGTQLMAKGIDVTLDQWATRYGGDLHRFMINGISESDRVLVICTPQYVQKSKLKSGGVAFESQVVNHELYQNTGTEKFIPIMRVKYDQETGKGFFIGSRLYIDFTDDTSFESALEELWREIHNMPAVVKPPLGKKPSRQTPLGHLANPERVPQSPHITTRIESTDARVLYPQFVALIRGRDRTVWRRTSQRLLAHVFGRLSEWRSESDSIDPRSIVQKTQRSIIEERFHQCVTCASPMFAMIVAGVESGDEEFRFQESMMTEWEGIPNWSRAGWTAWGDAPSGLCYVTQAMIGAMAVLTGQFDLITSLVNYRLKNPLNGQYEPLLENHTIMLGSHAINGHADSSGNFSFLLDLWESQSWLTLAFDNRQEYISAMTAHFITLNTIEFFKYRLSNRLESMENPTRISFDAPTWFLIQESHEIERAITLIRRSTREFRKSVMPQFTELPQTVIVEWKIWASHCLRSVSGQHHRWSTGHLYTQFLGLMLT